MREVKKNKIVETEKLNKLLFNSEQITTIAIAEATDINYQTLYKYRTKQTDIESMKLDFAIRLNEYYDNYYQIKTEKEG